MITSPANTAIKAARRLVRRHGRVRGEADFLVEGPQALREAGENLRRVLVADTATAQAAAAAEVARGNGVEVLTATADVLADVTDTATSQGVVGIAQLPEPALDAVLEGARLVIVLHQVRDPGNAGTAVRSADAAGADVVVLTRGSVDVRNPKVVRASAGSLFHLPVVQHAGLTELIAACHRDGLQVIGTSADGATNHTDADLAGPTALLFGNEAHGLDGAARGACDALVRVPLRDRERPGYHGAAESLNLAATVAVVAYEAARQQTLRLTR